MVKQLDQKKDIFNSRKFILYSDKIHVELKDVRTTNSYEVKLDEIGYNKYYQSDSKTFGIIAQYIFIAIPIIVWVDYFINPSEKKFGMAVLNTIIFWGIALFGYLKKNKDDIYLLGGKSNLVFYRAIPNEEVVLGFIDDVVNTSKKYLKDKYTVIDTNIPEELFMERLYWLVDKEIISESEMYVLKEEYEIQKLVS